MTKWQHALYLTLFVLLLSAHITVGFRLRNVETKIAVLETKVSMLSLIKTNTRANSSCEILEVQLKDDEYTMKVYQDFVNTHLTNLWYYVADTQVQVTNHEDRIHSLEINK